MSFIERSYETPRERISPAGTHVMLLWGGLLCPHGGLGTDAAVGDCYAHVMLLLWGADAAVGWE